ncbi:unnamed protein product [Cylicostephanus goldi]|uniref:Uncharacterized protein n=1 Tax=Cylicostephanus goldi TaxID=71465 RepID=A0A3P6RMT4_CYLGO|nr:unnamed protein product [Cylicostephanus goldi]
MLNYIENEPDTPINMNVAVDPQLLDISQMESFVDISKNQTAYADMSSEPDSSSMSQEIRDLSEPIKRTVVNSVNSVAQTVTAKASSELQQKTMSQEAKDLFVDSQETSESSSQETDYLSSKEKKEVVSIPYPIQLSTIPVLTTTEATTEATTTKVTEDVSTIVESSTIRKRSSVSDRQETDLKITAPVSNAKEYDWSIISSTASPFPPSEGVTTIKTPTIVRYFVKITRNPWLKKIPADEAYFFKNTTPMPLTSTTKETAGDIIADEVIETSEAETSAASTVTPDSTTEMETFPIGRIPDFVPIGNIEEIVPIWKGDFFESAEAQDQERERKPSIIPKLFDEATATVTSENTNDPFDIISTTSNVIETSEAEAPEPTTDQDAPNALNDTPTTALSLSSKFSGTFDNLATQSSV